MYSNGDYLYIWCTYISQISVLCVSGAVCRCSFTIIIFISILHCHLLSKSMSYCFKIHLHLMLPIYGEITQYPTWINEKEFVLLCLEGMSGRVLDFICFYLLFQTLLLIYRIYIIYTMQEFCVTRLENCCLICLVASLLFSHFTVHHRMKGTRSHLSMMRR